MSTLYIVATPIGNLEDISFRALSVLKQVDVVLAEDTRVAKKLLSRYDVTTSVRSYHQRSNDSKTDSILKELLEGKDMALITDSGTPGVSDPGNELIKRAINEVPDINIIPIPGPSAVTAMASICGFPMNRFVFLGYPPHKKGRKKFFEEVANSRHPCIFYESPHRIIKGLTELNDISPGSRCVVGRELTKQFETVYRGTVQDVLDSVKIAPIKGEFVVATWSKSD